MSGGWSDGDFNACQWRWAAETNDGANLKLEIFDQTNSGFGNNITGKYACGELQSLSSQSYGLYQVSMRTVAGSGLNTAFFTYTSSPTWDEIDIEMLGLHPTQMSPNYFTGGSNAGLKPINLGFDSSVAFHTYGILWQPTSITWYVDNKQVFKNAPSAKIPSHPSRMYTEFWAGGASENGWLGKFTYTKPLAAEYQWASFTPISDPHVQALIK